MDLANSIVSLQPGMYILRHPKTGLPPISISRAASNPANNGRIQALYTPGTEGSLLRDGRDCIVMHVSDAPVDLLVTAYLEKAGAAVPSLKIDKIALEGEVATPQAKTIQVPPKGISLIGHIERRGDAVASQGERLGEVSGDFRLEGFQIAWPDQPAGVELAYSAHVEGGGPPTTVTTGNFCGTRNSAKRIIGVKFELVGPKAAEYKLQGHAYFSGGFSSPLSSGALLTGPSGLEHLTALSLDVRSPAKGKNKNPWEASAQTRILKAPAGGRKKP